MSDNIERKNFIWNMIGLFFNCFNSFFFLVIVTRINGVEKAGIFTYAFSLASLFCLIAMYYSRTFQLADLEEKFCFEQYLSTRLMTVFISLVFIILFALGSQFSFYKAAVIALIMCYRSLEAVSDCLYGYIQKENQLYYVGKSITAKAVLSLFLFLAVDFMTGELLLAIFAQVVCNAFILLFFDWRRVISLRHKGFRFMWEGNLLLLRSAFSIFIFSFLGNLIFGLQKYVMTYYVSNEQQTIYGIVIMPATVLSLIGNCILNPYLTKLSMKNREGEYASFHQLLRKLQILLVGSGFLVLGGCWLLGIPVLDFVYGLDLAEYKYDLIVVLLVSILSTATSIYSGGLTILGVNNSQMYLYLISAAISFAASITMIRAWGMKGAFRAFYISMICHFILYLLLYSFVIKRKLHGSSAKGMWKGVLK